MRYRLLAGSTHIHVDFHADRYFNDFRRFPGHWALPLLPGEFRPCRLRYCGSKSSPVKSFAWNRHLFMLHRKVISRVCVDGPSQNGVGSSLSRLFVPLRIAILDVTGRYRLRIENSKKSRRPPVAGRPPEPGFSRCRDIISTPVSATS